MTIAKRILAMAAALSIISNNSIPMGLINTSGDNGIDGRARDRGVVNNGSDELTTSDETTTDDETTGSEDHSHHHCKPKLDLKTANLGKWVKNMDGWDVHTDPGASIYYRLSTSLFEAGPLDIATGAAKSFGGDFKNIEEQQGNFYICFYAKWDDSENKSIINTSSVMNIKLDSKKPYEVKLNYHDILPFIINESPIIDETSGIEKVYCSVGKKYDKLEDIKKHSYDLRLYPVDENDLSKGYNIFIPANPFTHNKKIYVYAVDKSGNYCDTSFDVEDIDRPELEYYNSYNIDNGKVKESVTQAYGDDRIDEHKLTNYTYVNNQNSYLKVKLSDSNREDCSIKVFWGVSDNKDYKIIKISELRDPVGVKHEEDVVYIPFSMLGLKDSKEHGSYQFKLRGYDKYNHKSEEWVIEKEFWYSETDEDDADVDFNLIGKFTDKSKITNESGLSKDVDAYFYDKPEEGNNALQITLLDDLGIAEYDVKITKDNKEFWSKNGDKTKGNLKDGKVKDSEGNETSEVVSYYEAVTSLPSDKIELKDDGVYEVDIKISDIDGNIKTYHRKYVVDTTNPSIDNLTYEATPELNYTTYGIFVNDTVKISFKAKDNLVGINADDIRLHIGEGDDETYIKADPDGDGFAFTVKDEIDDKAYITVKDRLNNEATYYFRTVKKNGGVLEGAKLSENVDDKGVKLILDSKAPDLIFEARGTYETTKEGGKDVYFFGGDENNALCFGFSDNKGLKEQVITISKDGEGKLQKYSMRKDYTKGEEPILKDGVGSPYVVPISDLDNGVYSIEGYVKDLAGSVTPISSKFVVDRLAPTITDKQFRAVRPGSSEEEKNDKKGKDVKDKPGKEKPDDEKIDPKDILLNFAKFGIYGHETINISIIVKDEDHGSGVKGARLVWGDATKDKDDPDKDYIEAVRGNKPDEWVFEGLTYDHTGVPYIEVEDNLGNKNHYYFTTNSPIDNVGKLLCEEIEDANERISLTLENDEPYVDIYADQGSKSVTIDGAVWYKDKINYRVLAHDQGTLMSGLKSVSLYNDSVNHSHAIKTEDEYNDIKFADTRYTAYDPTFGYSLTEEGKYSLRAVAEDNAGNKAEKPLNFNIDTRKPEITKFVIGNNEDPENAPYEHRDTYGYFFKEETTVKVYVRDPGHHSGIDYVMLYTKKADGTETSWKDHPDDKGCVTFTIPKGFKGHIGAEAFDKVGHPSGIMSPDGTIIEDKDIHDGHASVTITPVGTDKNGFYNHALTLNVTVKDSFSGIAGIDWSIGKDNKSGHLSADGTSLISNADVSQQVIKTDANLITEASFQIVVESDVSDNPVEITLTDNAGNQTIVSDVYSLDLTAPAIDSSLSNTDAKNGMYYDSDQSVNLSIVEHNFDPGDAKVLVNGEEQKVSWGGQEGNSDVHTATVNLTKDGDYTVSLQYTDLAGNPSNFTPDQHFIIDKTKPVITNNFADFKTGTPDEISGSTELYYNNQGERKAAFEVNVVDKNFEEEDLRIKVLSKQPGSSHKEDSEEEWYETHPDYTWTHDTSKDSHTLNFALDEDSVYKIEIKPQDRAGNSGEIAEGSDSKTDIFEVDTTVPVLGARSDGDYAEITDDKYDALAVYDLERFEDEAPYVEFNDINLYRLDYELTSFKPVYSDGREIGQIQPEEMKSDEDYSDYEKDKTLLIKKSEKAMDQDVIRYTLPDFEEDGVYSVKLYAVDMAGNKSELSENTYVRLMNTSMLAYIENSDKKEGTGWYSFEDDEYGPISKQPTSFDDLDIVMFSKTGTTPRLLLVDKDTEAETDTYATSTSESLIENDLYMVNANRYKLSGDYFARNYTEDTDTRLYLRAENDGEYVDLGEMYIDNTKPECAVPEYLKNWGWLKGSGEQTITFSNISEVLDDKETVVYINGQEITADGLSAEIDGKLISASYNVKNDELSVTLPTGDYSIGAKLVDKAGNMRIITEVEHFSVGNTRIWLGAGGAAMLIITVGGISIIAKGKRRRASNR